jgi:hypothetical protein
LRSGQGNLDPELRDEVAGKQEENEQQQDDISQTGLTEAHQWLALCREIEGHAVPECVRLS